MSTVSSVNESVEQPIRELQKRGCLFYINRGLKWLVITDSDFAHPGFCLPDGCH